MTAFSAAAAVTGRLPLGEAITAGLLSVAAGLGVGGLIDATRHDNAGPLRYALPCLAVAVVGYTLLYNAARKRRPHALSEKDLSIAYGGAVVAATVVATFIAAWAAKAVAGHGAPTWVVPTLVGVITFAAGAWVVARRRPRASEAITGGSEAVRSRTAIAVTIGLASAFFSLSFSILAVVPLVALPFTIAFMWTAARRASGGGRLLISFVAFLDLWPISGWLFTVVGPDGGDAFLKGGATVSLLLAGVFWATATRDVQASSVEGA